MCLDVASQRISDSKLNEIVIQQSIPLIQRSLCYDDFPEYDDSVEDLKNEQEYENSVQLKRESKRKINKFGVALQSDNSDDANSSYNENIHHSNLGKFYPVNSESKSIQKNVENQEQNENMYKIILLIIINNFYLNSSSSKLYI